MGAVYQKIREVARKIADRYPNPEFYSTHRLETKTSLDYYQSDELINRLRKEVADYLGDNAGHGLGHAEKVAIDAGTLVIIENQLAGKSKKHIHRGLLLAQCAGLLHDIRRKEKAHAQKGAETARDLLQSYPLASKEVNTICLAIGNHEAFSRLKHLPDNQSRIISDCLYDADKFRWGPDNFTHTVWDMVSNIDPPLDVFMRHYPRGMAVLKKIRGTFRSQTGQKFGPQFIDLGISIGEELYLVIMDEFVK